MLPRPKPEQFGLTDDTINEEKEFRYKENRREWWVSFFWGGMFWILIFIIASAKYELLLAYFIVGLGVFVSLLPTRKVNSSYDKYLKAIADWEKTQKEYWTDISGREFECRISELFDKMGFHVVLTPGSNDGGVDIIATAGKECFAIQCKCHKKPVGPKDIRELYGVVAAHKEFTKGILICPSGFTQGVYSFALGKPLQLMDIKSIMYCVASVTKQKK